MGGRCSGGDQCPRGTGHPVPCPPGQFCGTGGGIPTGPCDSGYYCLQGSHTARPGGESGRHGAIGDECPAGNYCPTGSSGPTPCPIGTISNSTGADNVSTCQPCPAGYVCDRIGAERPTKACPPGKFCREAEQPRECHRGSFCPEGSREPLPCEAGSYQNMTGQATCSVCPSRTMCSLGSIAPQPCRAGYVCVAGSAPATAMPCLPGTFSNRTDLASTDECEWCSPGKYCSVHGLTAPEGECAPGHFCRVGSAAQAPDIGFSRGYVGLMSQAVGFYALQGTQSQAASVGLLMQALQLQNMTGDICPPGHYCPAGSAFPLACPTGTHLPSFGASSGSACIQCPPGRACNAIGLNSTGVGCPAGYYC